jgi:hypothetical protein
MTTPVARAAFPNGWLVIRVRDALAELFPPGRRSAFDFDEVLTRGDCHAHLVRQALQRSWWRRLAMLPVLAAAMPMLKVPALQRLGQRLVVRLAFVGWSTARFNARAARFGRRLAPRPPGGGRRRGGRRAPAPRIGCSRGGGDHLRAARGAGREELGLSSVGLVASQPTRGWLGLRAPLRHHGAEKVRRLAAHGLQPCGRSRTAIPAPTCRCCTVRYGRCWSIRTPGCSLEPDVNSGGGSRRWHGGNRQASRETPTGLSPPVWS